MYVFIRGDAFAAEGLEHQGTSARVTDAGLEEVFVMLSHTLAARA